MGQKVTGIPFGTLHLALCGRQRIVVCSDSRGHSDNTGPFAEDFQKLFQAGKRTLCGTSGVLTLPPNIYVSSLIAAICAEDRLADSPRELLSAIRDKMRGPLAGVFAENPLPDLPSVFSAFSIRRLRAGEIDLFELTFPIETTPKGERFMAEPTITARIDGIIPPGPFVYHASRGDCLPADLSGLDSDSPDSKVLGDVDKIFEAARATNASCRDEIGGPIDVAAIDSHRVHWLRRKPFAL